MQDSEGATLEGIATEAGMNAFNGESRRIDELTEELADKALENLTPQTFRDLKLTSKYTMAWGFLLIKDSERIKAYEERLFNIHVQTRTDPPESQCWDTTPYVFECEPPEDKVRVWLRNVRLVLKYISMEDVVRVHARDVNAAKSQLNLQGLNLEVKRLTIPKRI